MALTTYQGSCHCGAVRFSVDADLSSVITCNCSMCGRTGSLLAFVPESQFRLESGEDAQTDYQFNRKIIHHLFCKTCGIRTFSRGLNGDKVTYAIHVRSLHGLDPWALSVKHVDGRSL